MGTILAFDFGLARIGVAVGETETGNAHPLTAIADEVNAVRFAAIEALLAEWKPAGLVVGLPTHLDGSEHAMTARCRRFANQLHGRYGLPVALVDERSSSVEAAQRFALDRAEGRRRRRDAAALDAVAAAVIVERWLSSPRDAQPLA